jgi:probable rRNA maturation factor
MSPVPDGVNVTVSNRQRLLKVDSRRLKKIAQRALELVEAPDDQLSVVLVTDKTIAKLNKKFHQTDGPTDVLSFKYGGRPLTGEVILSVEHALSQAKRFKSTPGREIVLYVVHGILHLHGYNDHRVRDRSRMRTVERSILTALAGRFAFRELAKVRRLPTVFH